jgi:hypothetical protein
MERSLYRVSLCAGTALWISLAAPASAQETAGNNLERGPEDYLDRIRIFDEYQAQRS